MRKYIIIVFAAILMLLNSCIEIGEKITINKDLSGHVEYQLSISEFASIFSGFIDNSIEIQVKSEAGKFIEKLRDQPGISNVVYQSNLPSEGIKVSFDYASTRDFNNALFAMGDAKKNLFTPGYLKANRHRVKKINFSNYLALYLKKEDIEIPEQYLTDMIKFRSTISVPKEIKKSSGNNIKLSDDKFSAIQIFPVKQILHDKVNTGVKIRY